MMLGWTGAVCAEPLIVPDGSFEQPGTQYVSTHIGSWQETPKPADFDEGGGFLWDQLTGVFRNTAPGAADHIVDCDGLQAVYFFAVPHVGLFQDNGSMDWQDTEPSHRLDIVFEAGISYELTFGVVAGGGNMLEGVSFEAALYFRGDDNEISVVAKTDVVFTRAAFPDRAHLTDFKVKTPVVQATDAWAGKHVGIRFLSTVSEEMKGGYWDLDNVRLTAAGEPAFALDVARVGSDLQISWPSATGRRYQLSVSADLRAWTAIGETMTGSGGTLATLVQTAGPGRQFYRVAVVPTP